MFRFSKNQQWILASVRFDSITNPHSWGTRSSRWSPLQTRRILLFNNDIWGRFMQDWSLNLAFIGYLRSLSCWTCPESWRTSIISNLGRVDLSFKTAILLGFFWVLSLTSASKFFSFWEATFLGENFLGLLCLLIVQFLQVRLASKSEDKKFCRTSFHYLQNVLYFGNLWSLAEWTGPDSRRTSIGDLGRFKLVCNAVSQ